MADRKRAKAVRSRTVAGTRDTASTASARAKRRRARARPVAFVRGQRGNREGRAVSATDSARRNAPAGLGKGERGRVEEPQHTSSPTAVAAEALRTGVIPSAIPPSRDDEAIPGEARRIRVGDPDDEALDNEYVGEETPGGSTPTPDQSDVDEIGRAYGVEDEDSGELRTSSEMLVARDKRRRGATLSRRGR